MDGRKETCRSELKTSEPKDPTKSETKEGSEQGDLQAAPWVVKSVFCALQDSNETLADSSDGYRDQLVGDGCHSMVEAIFGGNSLCHAPKDSCRESKKCGQSRMVA